MESFRYEKSSETIIYGEKCVLRIKKELEKRGLERVLVVTGNHVGENRDVMDPVLEGIDEYIVEVFDKTTPAKYIETVFEGINELNEWNADTILSVGGGSSMDIGKAMSAFSVPELTRDIIFDQIRQTGSVELSPYADSFIPQFVVPTTLSGADLSKGCGIKLTSEPKGPPDSPDDIRSIILSESELMPNVAFYDPQLFMSTPQDVLTASAMNGFDKGIDTLYSRSANPISDATAIHGLKYLQDSLPKLDSDNPDIESLGKSIIGTILVQNSNQNNIIHAFGHGFSFHYKVQQGTIHGILAPHVLEYVFGQVDGRRELLAEGLELDVDKATDEECANQIVNRVYEICRSLGFPSQLRSIEGVEKSHLPAIAKTIAADHGHERNPSELEPESDDIERILYKAW